VRRGIMDSRVAAAVTFTAAVVVLIVPLNNTVSYSSNPSF